MVAKKRGFGEEFMKIWGRVWFWGEVWRFEWERNKGKEGKDSRE